MYRVHWASLPLFFALAFAGCGSSSSPEPESPWVLRSALGAYGDGSGRLGIAFLQTLRDDAGVGAGGPWSVTLRHESGVTLTYTYDAAGPGSHQTMWRFDTAPLSGRWDIEARSASAEVFARADLPSGGGLPPPVISVAPDASAVEWSGVEGAAAYLCRVYASGGIQHEAWLGSPGCDLTSLPPGAYSASILAFSADPRALAADASRSPALPSRFDVSEARLGFTRTDGSTPAQTLRAVGGAYDNGVGPRSVAVWLALQNTDGSGVTSDWQVEVVGPGLPSENPLAVTYQSGFPRLMAWGVGLNAVAGIYTATASSGAQMAASQFTVGTPAWLVMPSGVVAADGAQGSARITWEPAAGAVNYLASVYDAVTGELVASQWSASTTTDFVAGTFTAGRSYDAFIAASDVDMVGGAIPTQISIAENVFDYSTFVAR